MPPNIDTALLRSFVAVVEAGGMTNAARLLNLTQAAVSQQIKRLEDLFQQPLFDREGRQLRLMPRGERLFAQAQRLLAMNDEIWGMMTSPDYEGEVRLGVPHDIVAAFIPPILKSFDQAWPRVHVTLVSNTTVHLLQGLKRGDVDLTLTTEEDCPQGAETLMPDELVWVGAPGGWAHTRDPLPVSLGDLTCKFRKAAIGALTRVGRDWRSVCEVSSLEPMCVPLQADLAVAPLLASTVPAGLTILGPESGLPSLITFYINLHLPKTGASDIALELARHVRQYFAARRQRAA
ncbi:MAG: LysR family transcriptional regulator [Hyphomicrobiales bacterium]|nr:LysR family transcriptional regulator [Hyphomicrobiales bacterium]